MDVKKLLEILTVVEERGNPVEKPVLCYLHELIVLSTMGDKRTKIDEVDFEAFILADIEEYYRAAIDAVENTFPKIEQLANDITAIEAFQAIKMDYS